MQVLFYLSFSDQASRTNFVEHSIAIYNILNCPIFSVGKEQRVFEFRSERQPTLLSDFIEGTSINDV